MDKFHMNFGGGLAGGVKRIIAIVVMGALLILGLGAATLLTLAVVAAGAVMLTLGAVLRLFGWMRRGRREDGVLNARKGPNGWTVDTAGKFSL